MSDTKNTIYGWIVIIVIIIFIGWYQQNNNYEGKTAKEWRDMYYNEDSYKVRLYNCVSEHISDERTLNVCLYETPLP